MYIVLGSVTSATRFARALERAAVVPAYVVHTPSAIRSGGCSYSVNVSNMKSCEADFVRRLADEQGLRIKSIYSDEIRNGERVFDVVP